MPWMSAEMVSRYKHTYISCKHISEQEMGKSGKFGCLLVGPCSFYYNGTHGVIYKIWNGYTAPVCHLVCV